jgi:hypothetical protein
MQRELEHPPGRVALHFTRGQDGLKAVQMRATRPHDKLSDAALRVRFPIGILGCKTLIVMIVTVHYDINPKLVEHRPDRAHTVTIAVPT